MIASSGFAGYSITVWKKQRFEVNYSRDNQSYYYMLAVSSHWWCDCYTVLGRVLIQAIAWLWVTLKQVFRDLLSWLDFTQMLQKCFVLGFHFHCSILSSMPGALNKQRESVLNLSVCTLPVALLLGHIMKAGSKLISRSKVSSFNAKSSLVWLRDQ